MRQLFLLQATLTAALISIGPTSVAPAAEPPPGSQQPTVRDLGAVGDLLFSRGNAQRIERATVRDFGGVGDGRADDTEAIQEAVDAGVGDVCFPRGEYRITKTILIELDKVGPTSLVGSGTARLVMAGPGPAVKFVGTHGGTADPKSVQPNVWQRQRMPTARECTRAAGLETMSVPWQRRSIWPLH